MRGAFNKLPVGGVCYHDFTHFNSAGCCHNKGSHRTGSIHKSDLFIEAYITRQLISLFCFWYLCFVGDVSALTLGRFQDKGEVEHFEGFEVLG